MNLPPISEKWLESKQKKIKQYPQNNLRASSVGHECERYHFHSIKDWEEKTLHDPILQSIFDEGHLHETAVIKELLSLGFEVVEQQRAFQIEKPLITGHIDGIIRYEGKDYPFDVKSVSEHVFRKIDSIEDLMYSKTRYQRGYVAQLQLYLLMTNSEVGCFILKNKTTGELKAIWGQIDFDYCDKILKRAERVYKSIESNQAPKRIDDFDMCSNCQFAHVCLPDLKAEGLKQINDQEFGATLERLDQLKPVVKEFKELEKEVDKVKEAVGTGEYICGDYVLKINEYERVTKVALTWDEEKKTYLRKQILKLPTQKSA